jgi:hypothetical protein
MNVLLYIRESDLVYYLNGVPIDASTKENKSHVFDTHREDLLNVSVDAREIIKTQHKELHGMVRGIFTYYQIKKR